MTERTSTAKWAMSLATALAVSACVTDMPKPDENFKEAAIPATRTTAFDNVMYDFGKLLITYTGSTANFKPIYIQSKSISNSTGSQTGLPGDLTQMVSTAIGQVGAPLVYVPYDPSYELNEKNTGHRSFSRIDPEVVLSGAITEYDQDTTSTSQGTNVGIAPPMGGKVQPNADYSNSKTSGVSRLTLDFSVLDYRTQTALGPPVSNTITITKNTQDKSIAFSIFGVSLGVNGAVTQNQGVHAALRQLVNVSIVQVLGKYYGVPYWRVFPGGQVDKRMSDETLAQVASEGRLKKLQGWLIRYGKYPETYPNTEQGVLEQLRQVGAESGKNYNFASLDSIPDDTLLSIYYDTPFGFARSQYLEMKKNNTVIAAKQTQAGGLAVTTDSSEYNVRGNMEVTVAPSSDGYLYCFWEQGSGTSIRVFPNRFKPRALVKGGDTVTIPDSSMPFRMKFDTAHTTEKVGCFLSAADLQSKLPPNLAHDLEDMRGVKMGDIDAQMRRLDPAIQSQVRSVTVR